MFKKFAFWCPELVFFVFFSSTSGGFLNPNSYCTFCLDIIFGQTKVRLLVQDVSLPHNLNCLECLASGSREPTAERGERTKKKDTNSIRYIEIAIGKDI